MNYTITPIAMPAYVCHKTVNAAKIVGWEDPNLPDKSYVIVLMVGDKRVTTMASLQWVEKHANGHDDPKALVGGYMVRYQDGYVSWSPAKAFEDGYVLSEGTGGHAGATRSEDLTQ